MEGNSSMQHSRDMGLCMVPQFLPLVNSSIGNGLEVINADKIAGDGSAGLNVVFLPNNTKK